MSTKRSLPLFGLLLTGCSGAHHAAAPPPVAPGAVTPTGGDHSPAEHGHHQAGGDMNHRFEDAAQWAKVFDDPARDAWQKPDEVVAALRLPPTAAVADIGAGTGYFSMRLARAVPEGRVYAADIEPDMVHYLSERAEKEGLPNVSAILSAPDSAALPAPVDCALVVNTYHHISDRVAYFTALKASLNPGARLAIVDFTLESELGPPAEHRLAPEQVAEELRAAGFAPNETLTFLPNQYFLIFDVAQGP